MIVKVAPMPTVIARRYDGLVTIADRLAELAERAGSLSALARTAHKSRTTAEVTIKRLRKRPLAVQLDTLEEFARAGGVSLRWLVFGDEETAAVPRDERERAAAAARLLGYDPADITEATATGRDRSAREWLRRIELEEERRLDGLRDLPDGVPRARRETPTGELALTSIRGTRIAPR